MITEMRDKYLFIKKEFDGFCNNVSKYLDKVFQEYNGDDLNYPKWLDKIYTILPYSGLIFFLLAAQIPFRTRNTIGVVVAFFMVRAIVKRSINIDRFVHYGSIKYKLGCLLTSLGIIFENQRIFYDTYLSKGCPECFSQYELVVNELFYVTSLIMGVLSVPFVYMCIIVFFQEFTSIFSLKDFFKNMSKTEIVIYFLICLVSIIFMGMIFSRTNAFYSSGINYDVIYTSDSSQIFHDNAYLSLYHLQNDFRQPLFAVFSAPFLGMVYLVAKVFCLPEMTSAILTNSIQICILVLANLMLGQLLNIRNINRICFVLFMTSTYTYMLFILMMEQYVFAYFWLVFFIYSYAISGYVNKLVFFGAGSTLLTSFVIFPIVMKIYKKFSLKTFFLYLKDFLFLLMLFGKTDVIINSIKSILFYMNFTGKGIPLIDRVYQYIAFIQSCFITPIHKVDLTTMEHISWQLDKVSTLSVIGCGILFLVVVSAVLNRNDDISNIASSWIIFSSVMLCALGWGTKENGLILYSLYFGWAFVLSVFLLIQNIEFYTYIKYFSSIIVLVISLVMFELNFDSIFDVVYFAIKYYPS